MLFQIKPLRRDMNSNLSEYSVGDTDSQCSDRNNGVISLVPSLGNSCFISESSSPPSINGTDELKAVHLLEDMGYTMEVALKAINVVKSTDIPTLLNHILTLGRFSNI